MDTRRVLDVTGIRLRSYNIDTQIHFLFFLALSRTFQLFISTDLNKNVVTIELHCCGGPVIPVFASQSEGHVLDPSAESFEMRLNFTGCFLDGR